MGPRYWNLGDVRKQEKPGGRWKASMEPRYWNLGDRLRFFTPVSRGKRRRCERCRAEVSLGAHYGVVKEPKWG